MFSQNRPGTLTVYVACLDQDIACLDKGFFTLPDYFIRGFLLLMAQRIIV